MRRSREESYYIVDTFLLKEHFPTITLLGSSGNTYHIIFSRVTIRCSCPDSTSPCKHMLFIFNLLHLNPATGAFRLHIPHCLSKIRTMRPFHTNRLNHRANYLCCTFLFKQCACCIQSTSSNGHLYVCNECDHLMHGSHMPEPIPTHCPICRSEWNPFQSTTSGGYRNFSSLLNRLGYDVNSPTIQDGHISSRCYAASPKRHTHPNSSSVVIPFSP